MRLVALPGASRRTGLAHQAFWIMLLMLLLGGAIVARLAWLQLLHGSEFKVIKD